jgi:hypothetical protein
MDEWNTKHEFGNLECACSQQADQMR